MCGAEKLILNDQEVHLINKYLWLYTPFTQTEQDRSHSAISSTLNF
jgi:hypothetical protein